MNWQLVPQQFVTGLLNGGIIAIIALGIVLIYRSSEVFNFSHGQMCIRDRRHSPTSPSAYLPRDLSLIHI